MVCRQLCYLQPVKIQIDSLKIGIRTRFFSAKILLTFDIFKDFFGLFRFILKQICLFQLSLYTFSVFFRFILKQIWFVSVVSMHIFGLFWFILKQNCLFRMFRNSFETPKQTETRLSLVSKMNRNKRETDPVSVIFGSNLNFFLFVLWTWMYTVKIS